MTELALLSQAFSAVPEPDEATVNKARAILLRTIAATEGGSVPDGARRTFVSRLRARTSPRLRIVLVAIALLLLLAGIATATYLGVRTWVSSGPRGVQYQSDYRLATAFSASGSPTGWSPGGNPVRWWRSLALGPGGHDLYAMTLPPGDTTPKLIRVDGIDRGSRRRATQLLDLADLHLPGWCVWPFVRPLTVAPNADVFFVVGGLDLRTTTSNRVGCAPTGAMNDAQAFLHPAATGLRYSLTPAESAARNGRGHLLLFVLHADGSRQLILRGSDLVRSRLFPADWMEWQVVASARDRLWLWVDPATAKGPQRLYQIIDPNADGDWSDRVVRAFAIPASLPFAKQRMGGFDSMSEGAWQLAAEPPVARDDRSRSVLAAMSNFRTGDFRVYRIADRNDDGDVLDRGEVSLVFTRPGAAGAEIAPRVIVTKGVAHEEFVLAGLSRPDRVSIVSGSRVERDVARGVRPLATVLAGPDGAIYPVTGAWDVDQADSMLVVHRLSPVAAGKSTIKVNAPANRTTARPVFFPHRLPGGVPRLEFAVPSGTGFDDYTVGADGRGLRKLIAHTWPPICHSADRRELVYTSDADVPTEFFVYVARSGEGPKKVTERKDSIVCPFAERWLVLYRKNGPTIGSLVRHDLRTGRDTVVVTGVDNRYVFSPDGTKLVYVRRGPETLRLLDLDTLRQRTLAGPLGDRYTYGAISSDQRNPFGLRWSADGTRIAYVVAPRVRRGILAPVGRRFELLVRDVASGRRVLHLPIIGGRPSLAWSPDGTRLLVCVADLSFESGCPGGPGDTFARRSWAIDAPGTPGRLLLVDLRRNSVNTVARGPLSYAGWAPSSTTFAYATPRALFLADSGGRWRKVSSLVTARSRDPFLRDDFEWLGWSPDGRYIGLNAGCGEKSPSSIQLIDVRTGGLRALHPFPSTNYTCITWWGDGGR